MGSFQRYRSVRAKRIRVEPDALLVFLCIWAIHLIEHKLVLQSVVTVYIPLAVLLERHTDFLVIGSLLQSLQNRLAERDAVDILTCDGVLCLHPLRRFATCVVLQPSVRVGNLLAEILVHDIVLPRLRISHVLRLHHCGGKQGRGCY